MFTKDLGQGETRGGQGFYVAVHLVIRWIGAGQRRDVGRQCQGNRGDSLFKQDPFLSQGIQVGGRRLAESITPQMVGARCVKTDNQHVANRGFATLQPPNDTGSDHRENGSDSQNGFSVGTDWHAEAPLLLFAVGLLVLVQFQARFDCRG